MVIGYQVDEFTHIWLAEYSIVQWHIYPGFMVKISKLIYFPLEPGCEDYSFLDQAVKGFGHGLNSILTDYINTSELDTALHGTDAMSTSVSIGFLHSVLFLILLDHS